MAWQVGVAQTVPLVCLLNGVPTTPTAAITTTVNVAGAGYGAATNGATVAGANGEASVLLTGAEMGAWGFVRVEGANGSIGIQPYTAEGDWTTARAAYQEKLNVAGTLAHSGAADSYKADVSALALETTLAGVTEAVGELPNTAAIGSALATAHGSGRWDSAGTVAVATAIQRIITDENSELLLIRGDTHALRFRFLDEDSRVPIDLTGHTMTLTIRDTADRDSTATDDSDAVATITGTITEDETDGDYVTFEPDPDEIAAMERDVDYDYDVQGVDGTSVTTFIRGIVKRTFDVTRATS